VFNGLEDADGCPDSGRLRVIGTVVDLDPIQFETDSAQIVDNNTNREILDELAQLLTGRPDIQQLEVEGHTDETGNSEGNWELSSLRAVAVVQAMQTRGPIDGKYMEATGFGQFRPSSAGAEASIWVASG
jgi:outer membrane protein OmpA-like peptidoglycan-associated protein